MTVAAGIAAAAPIPELRTERLRLRAPRASDLDAYAAFGASARARWVGGPFDRFQAFQKLCALVGHWSLRGFGRWMVADGETDAPLGVVGLLEAEGWPEPELAWVVFEAGEGRGVAHEAALAARRYAYDMLGWTTAMSLIAPDNSRSQALARRLGAVRTDNVFSIGGATAEIWRHPGPEGVA
jgi:RimJ/RimL family protein N-acetyltransferase